MSNIDTSERWAKVASHGSYEVSSLGRVRKGHRTLVASRERYEFVRLAHGRVWSKHYVHRLVAGAFCERRSATHAHVNHINGDRFDNRASNLEWVTQRENNMHGYREGLIPSGSEHHWSVLSAEQVESVRTRYRGGGVSQRKLASEFGVSQGTISAIVRGKTHNSREKFNGK